MKRDVAAMDLADAVAEYFNLPPFRTKAQQEAAGRFIFKEALLRAGTKEGANNG